MLNVMEKFSILFINQLDAASKSLAKRDETDTFFQIHLKSVQLILDVFSNPKYVSITSVLSNMPSKKAVKYLENFSLKLDLSEIISKQLLFIAFESSIDLIKPIFRNLEVKILSRLGISVCQVISSHLLTRSQQDQIRIFLEKKIAKKIVCNFDVDTNLIFGIRAVCDDIIWECSLNKNFKTFSEHFLDWVRAI